MSAAPSYRRPLNSKQLAVLKYIYRFRFTTTQLLSQTLNIPQRKARERLQILYDQDYIGRRDDAGFRLPGQFAIYYLKPKGVNALTDLPDDLRTKALRRRLTRDDDRSDSFIHHCLGLFGIYCQLQTEFGDRLRFFARSDLGPYHYFPSPLPDAYIRLDKDAKEQQFFLVYVDVNVPLKAAIARIEQFDEYADDDDWQEATRTPNPTTIFVVEKAAMHKKLHKYLADELDNSPLLRVTSGGEVGGVVDPKERPNLPRANHVTRLQKTKMKPIYYRGKYFSVTNET